MNNPNRVFDFSVFSVEEVPWSPNPVAEVRPYVVLRMRPWVNVIAFTPENQVVFVRQFRFGIKDFTLEFPAGSVDDGEQAGDAATRELLEETGYTGDQPIALGTMHPNPAIQNNVCSTWLIRNARKTKEPHNDPHESLEIFSIPFESIPELIATGQITHALTIAGFCLMKVQSEMS